MDLQLKTIVNVYEDHGSPDRIPAILEAIPRKLTDLYRFLLKRLVNEDDNSDRAERAKRAFQWILYSERPLTIGELEDAISVSPNQKSWRPPSVLNRTRLARLCGNLINYDETSGTLSLAHRTVGAFLLEGTCAREIPQLSIEEATAQEYLSDICLTYLSFTDFHKAISRTSDTTNLTAISQPVRLIGSMAPSSIRPWALSAANSRRARKTPKQPFDLVNALRTELSSHQAKPINSRFPLLEYCKIFWVEHSHYIDLHDDNRITTLKKTISGTLLPNGWVPWASTDDELPALGMLFWVVGHVHRALFRVWHSFRTSDERAYWSIFWKKEGSKLFASACTFADYEQLEMILRAKRRVDLERPAQSEVLEQLVSAALSGNLGVAHRLLLENPWINSIAPRFGKTALQAAAERGHFEVVELLLHNEADVNAPVAITEGRTALQAAAGGGHLTIVEILLQKGALVNASAAGIESGRTALQAAAEGGHLAVVERLLQEKAYVNAPAAITEGRTALQAAAEAGHLAVVRRLLQAKADVNAPPGLGNGTTALQAAAKGGHLEVVDRLLKAGALVNRPPWDDGRTALQWAANEGHLEVVERLLQANADVDAEPTHESPYSDTQARTALQAASENGHIAVVERLLQANSNVNALPARWNGRTALQAAAENGHFEVVEMLLRKNANVNAEVAPHQGCTALLAAAKEGHLEVVDRLLKAGAVINAISSEGGMTALQAAREEGHTEIVERLLKGREKNHELFFRQ